MKITIKYEPSEYTLIDDEFVCTHPDEYDSYAGYGLYEESVRVCAICGQLLEDDNETTDDWEMDR